MVTGVASMTANVNASPVAAAIKDGGAPVKSDRRSNKPIMEKRRRARINNCLNELKTLILDATKKDPARHSKLEKADILEKTVKHLQELQRQQSVMQQAADPKVINKFKAGFTDCANEVSRFPGLEPSVKRRLLQHLTSCINGVKTELHQHQRQVAAAQAQQLHAHMLPSPPSSPPQEAPQSGATSAAAAAGYVMSSQIQQTANGYFLPNGLQVIPTKLANGSIALVLPHGMPAQQSQPQTSAVAAVAAAAAAAAVAQQQQFHLQQQQMQQQQQLQHFQQQQSQSPQSMPTRTASTGSASSHSSYERTMASSPAVSVSYAPPSPANSYEAMDCKPSVIQHAPASYGQPLSLVVKKHPQQHQQQPQIKEEEQPWRPW